MKTKSILVTGQLALGLMFAACTPQVPSSHVWLTSAAGDKCTEKEAVVFHKSSLPCGEGQGGVIY